MSIGWTETGRKRLLIAVIAIWLFGWYILQKPALDLWFNWLGATPSTKCVEIYPIDSPRLVDCELSAPGDWIGNLVRQEQGDHSALFIDYYRKNGRTDLVWWWLGIPFMLIAFDRLARWVLSGFQSKD